MRWEIFLKYISFAVKLLQFCNWNICKASDLSVSYISFFVSCDLCEDVHRYIHPDNGSQRTNMPLTYKKLGNYNTPEQSFYFLKVWWNTVVHIYSSLSFKTPKYLINFINGYMFLRVQISINWPERVKSESGLFKTLNNFKFRSRPEPLRILKVQVWTDP